MGVKSMDLFVIINVAFFVTKALNLMAMFHNPAWQFVFPFLPGFISGQSTHQKSLGDVSGCFSKLRGHLGAQGIRRTGTELRAEPAPGSRVSS